MLKIKDVFLVLFVGLACICGPASAQIVSGDPLSDLKDTVTDPIERQIESTVEDALSERVLDTPEALTSRLDDLIQPLPSDRLLSVPGEALETAGALASDLPLGDIVQGAETLLPLGRRAIEIDDSGTWPVLRDEWVALVANEDTALIDGLDVDIVERTALMSSEQTLFTIRVRSDSPDAARAEDILETLGADRVDRNYVYRGAKGLEGAETGAASDHPASAVTAGRLGLIDTALDREHPGLARLRIAAEDFVTLNGNRPLAHGTGVASILGRNASDGLEVFAASVFFLGESGETGASTASLVKAVDWMLANNVPVINFSLTGPPDRALEQMIDLCNARGVQVVAAVGNGGPAAAPRYPAAYDGVIGVTAVDSDGLVYRWANRGDYVDIAALGVGVEIALPGGGWTRDSGTSLAAPLVSVFLASENAGDGAREALFARVSAPGETGDASTLGRGILRLGEQ